MQEDLNIFCDGGSRGNPGPAACAFIAELKGKPIHNQSKFLGKTTNNVAEYNAVLLAVNWLVKNKSKYSFSKIIFNLDSLLVVSQLKGKYKIKNENLRNLFFSIKKLEEEINIPVDYKHIYREKNKLADLLVNKNLDKNFTFTNGF